MAEKGYEGTITNAGAQKVKAPQAKQAPKGKGVVKTGTDLRGGK